MFAEREAEYCESGSEPVKIENMLDDNFEGFSRILASQVFREALEGYNQILDH